MPNNGLSQFAATFKRLNGGAADIGGDSKLIEMLKSLSPEKIKALKAALGLSGEAPEEGEPDDPREREDFDEFEDDKPGMPGKTAMDGFARRFPAAARIVSGGLYAAIPDKGSPRKAQSAAQAAAFFSRFPSAARIR